MANPAATSRPAEAAAMRQAAELAQEARSLRRALQEGTITFVVAREGYGYTVLLSYSGAIALLAALAIWCYNSQTPFEKCSVTENMYVNNNIDINDCASNVNAKVSAWWKPERWAREVVWAGVINEHLTIVLSTRMMATVRVPEALSRLPRGAILTVYRNYADFWKFWNGTQSTGTGPMREIENDLKQQLQWEITRRPQCPEAIEGQSSDSQHKRLSGIWPKEKRWETFLEEQFKDFQHEVLERLTRSTRRDC